jgi:SAM-dependent methyltransferase
MEDKYLTPVQRAFSKQAPHYDEDDVSNVILLDWRKKVYAHVDRFIQPASRMLEINAGTGIDAMRFAGQGHSVLATDISPGMISEIERKISRSREPKNFRVKQCSFDALPAVVTEKFDYIFSNFGGLNCCEDLSRVAKDLPALLNGHGFVTWVIMPRICPWELGGLLTGRRNALRRLSRGGTLAQLEGEHFQTYYYSLSQIREAVGPGFKLVRAEGLGAVSPPPSSVRLALRHPRIYSSLKNLDALLTKGFPFNRWADHIIVTFQRIKF